MIKIIVISTFVLCLGCKGKSLEMNSCEMNIKAEEVDCTHQNLSKIPNCLEYTKTLILARNNIYKIPDDSFVHCVRLKDLNLAHNKIERLFPRSFNGLEGLLSLNLENNNIGKNNSFMKTSLTYLQKLKYLNIKNNSILSVPDITALISLKTLSMNLIEELAIGEHLKGLNSLLTLDLSGPRSACRSLILTSDTFSGLQSLHSLDLSKNRILKIWKGTFVHLRNLRFLDISFNKDLGFSGVENVTHDLPMTAIEIFKFQMVISPLSHFTMIEKTHLEELKKTKIRKIYADSNRISLVELGVIPKLPKSLEKISINDNFLMPGTYIKETQYLSIKVLNVSSSITHRVINEDNIWPWCIDAIKGFDFEFSFDGTRPSEYVKQKMKLATQNLEFLNIAVLLASGLPKTLREMNVSGGGLQFEIPEVHFKDNELERVDLSFNKFRSCIGPLNNLLKLNYLDLSSNNCPDISNVFFSGTPNIKTLMFQNNCLGVVFATREGEEVFRSLKHLETINLSDNKIHYLPKLIFRSQNELKEISLKRNSIEKFQLKLNHMKSLLFLDISNNNIRNIDPDQTDELETIAKENGKFRLDLRGNPIQCTCKNIKFLKWIASTKVNLQSVSSYLCEFANETKVLLKNPTELYKSMEKECSSSWEVILVVSITFIIFVVILVCGLIYRYRWKLRYLFFMAKSRYKRTSNVFPDEQIYDYDAFISYEDEDQYFVHNTLLTNIERDGQFKVCVHKRDFIAGNEIAANITDAIHRSRKTVCIITQNFLNSYWCMFEFNMARMESIYSRNAENVLYLIFLEQIPTKRLPLVLLELVQSRSYMEFPNDEYGNAVFWNNLKKVLSDRE
ncbi:toll-like receptor 4 [Mytilus californianus]|uniref:toll-like receptor 4 n=1 Tax=Mytilus californianus TaxID=6549 RepID=UPI002247FF2F|nr:toll-like receptor 4 [Mytilus californianus]